MLIEYVISKIDWALVLQKHNNSIQGRDYNNKVIILNQTIYNIYLLLILPLG